MSSSSYHAEPGGGGGGGGANNGGGGAVEAIDLDPSGSSSFFSADFKKHDDLKAMLDSPKDSLKLEAMKRIIGMVARGRDAGDLFPAVVKNVVSKNIEIKKLVYVYLTRYAEERQDVALLSISTFQRALKDPNQLIRASALRVLSSIRVPVIVPIVMLSIRDSAVDMSPFVRKTAAHAIPKLYSLDPDQKEELIGVIEKLLADRTTLVVGSAVMAFEEVCPERIELIHKNYRKLCNLLVDVEEWGQVVIINMLSRYARTQFADPNAADELEEAMEAEREFYSNSDESEEDDDDGAEAARKKAAAARPKMDSDHRLLLRSAKPLLQSRNASVVMATAQLYHHCAPSPEVQVVAKAMIRLLRSHDEVQAVVLNAIASMTSSRRKSRNSMFEPFLRNFFVRASDSTHIKILKLEIMTNMASACNIGAILREFRSYITGQDRACVAATIQAIGRCAASIEEVTDTCLNGLVHLLSNRDQAVVAESVVVIKKLLQTQSGDHSEIIKHMARLVDSIEVPAAKAAILWVMGEYCERVPKIAPDVLRKMAKSFTNEDPAVKMQTINLAAKLCLTNPGQTTLLAQYVFNLAKYDTNYDIRDRSRFLRAFVFPPPGAEDNKLVARARDIFLATKPAPVTESKFRDRDVYQLGSLSHFLNARATGYQDLPEFPETAPDPEVRNVEPPPAPNPWAIAKEQRKKRKSTGEGSKSKMKDFYSDSNHSENNNGSSGESSGESTSSGSEGSSESDDERETAAAAKVNGSRKKGTKTVGAKKVIKNDAESSSSSDDTSSGSDSSSSSSSSSEEEIVAPRKSKSKPGTVAKAGKKRPEPTTTTKKATNLDLLLDLGTDDPPTAAPVLPATTPSLGGFLSPTAATKSPGSTTIATASAAHVPTETTVILNKMASGGLQVAYRYTRSPDMGSASNCNIELTVSNLGAEDLGDVKVSSKALPPGVSMREFAGIATLAAGETRNADIGINFNDTTQAAKFTISAGSRTHQVTLTPTVGELIRAVQMPESAFAAEASKLRGMNETTASASIACDADTVRQRVYAATNVLQVPSTEDGVLKFAGQTLAAKALVLVTVKMTGDDAGSVGLVINCEKIVIGSMLAKEIKKALET